VSSSKREWVSELLEGILTCKHKGSSDQSYVMSRRYSLDRLIVIDGVSHRNSIHGAVLTRTITWSDVRTTSNNNRTRRIKIMKILSSSKSSPI
jgi:hypothetical protein